MINIYVDAFRSILSDFSIIVVYTYHLHRVRKNAYMAGLPKAKIKTLYI